VALELAHGVGLRAAAAVGPVGRHGLEGVGHEDDARLERDLIAAQAGGIAAAVGTLVVVEDPVRLLMHLVAEDDALATEERAGQASAGRLRDAEPSSGTGVAWRARARMSRHDVPSRRSAGTPRATAVAISRPWRMIP
jgi:hypothetical protein